MSYIINDNIENHFKDKNIEFTVGCLLKAIREYNKIYDIDIIMSVFNLSLKQAKLCKDIVFEINILNGDKIL